MFTCSAKTSLTLHCQRAAQCEVSEPRQCRGNSSRGNPNLSARQKRVSVPRRHGHLAMRWQSSGALRLPLKAQGRRDLYFPLLLLLKKRKLCSIRRAHSRVGVWRQHYVSTGEGAWVTISTCGGGVWPASWCCRRPRCSTSSPLSPCNVSSNVNLFPPARVPSSQKGGEGLWGIMLWYQFLFSSSVSRMSWASGCTRSAQVSHSGCTM